MHESTANEQVNDSKLINRCDVPCEVSCELLAVVNLNGGETWCDFPSLLMKQKWGMGQGQANSVVAGLDSFVASGFYHWRFCCNGKRFCCNSLIFNEKGQLVF